MAKIEPSATITYNGVNITGTFDKFLGKKVQKEVDTYIKDVGLAIMGSLTEDPPEGTPMDTQWAVYNWIITLDRPMTTPVGSRDISGVSRARTAQETSLSILANASLSKVDNIYINNNVPYIGDLDAGTSGQSPKGWVDRAVQRGLKYANSFKGFTI